MRADEAGPEDRPPTRPLSGRARRYGAALLVVGLALGVSYLLRGILRPHPTVLFFAAVVVTALFAGLGPSILATALSALAIEFVFFDPAWSLALHEVRDLIVLGTFGGVAVAVSWLAARADRSRRELARQRQEAEEATRRMTLLSEATRLMGEAESYDAALRRLAEYLCEEVAEYAITYNLEDDGTITRVGVAHADPESRPLAERLFELRRPGLQDELGAGAVIRTGEPMLAREIPPPMLERASGGHEEYLAILRRLDPVSSLLVPLRARGRTIGALALATTGRSGRRYDQEDLALAVELGYRLALVLENLQLLEKAREAVRVRERVMAVVAHDLRNPLSTIATAAALLDASRPEADRAEVGRVLRNAARQATALVDDLLDLSRIEAGEFHVEPRPVRVQDVLRSAREAARLSVRSKRLRLTVACDEGDREVRADPTRIRRVFSNLLDNAVKFSPDGGRVRLSARAEGAEVVFCVADEGSGIPPKDLPHVFEHFWQGTLGNGGAGLGLAIVRGIVEAHRGRVWAESEDGRGAAFHFSLPVAEPTAPGPEDAPAAG